MARQELLGVASSIGHRIARTALWDGRVCTWTVPGPDPAHQGVSRSLPAVAGGDVYRGSAGIAWFLGELHAVTGHPELARAAEGGILHALRLAESWPASQFAFYRGRVGVAYVATRLADLLSRPRLTRAARRTLAPLHGQEHFESGIDVVHGAAGAIPALLELRHQLNDDRLLTMALGLGERLFEQARRGPTGWSWDTVGPSVARHLTGLAHGASGIGLALLELYRATGYGAYRFAAEMAFLYERSCFDASVGNWPDYRHPELGDLTFGHPTDDPSVVRSSRTPEHGRFEPWRPRFANAWCHGAVGIGLARARAFELTGQPAYRRDAEAAIACSLSDAERHAGSLCLCHGLAGSGELLLQAAETFGDPAWRERSLEIAGAVRSHLHRANPQDPSLMLGDAGLGAFFLRLASDSTVSFLQRRPSLPDPALSEDRGYDDLAALSSQEYFGKTLRSFAALGVWQLEAQPRRDDGVPLARSPVETTYIRLRRLVGRQRGPRKKMLRDAFRRERLAYEMSLGAADFAEESVRRLCRAPVEDVPWDEALLAWNEATEMVTNHWDWEPWLRWGTDEEPAEDTVFAMLHRRRDRVAIHPAGPFTAAMLSGLATPVTLEELTLAVAEISGGTGPDDKPLLAEKVAREARNLYSAGFIDVVESPGVRHAPASAG